MPEFAIPNSQSADEIDFFTMRFHARLNHAGTVHIVPPSTPGDYHDPVIQEDGSYLVRIPLPESSDHHTALGRFMDHWSRLEFVLQELLAKVSDSTIQKTQVFVNALGTRSLVEVIQVLSRRKLEPVDQEILGRLLDRVLRFNIKRNYLVHGHWIIEAIVTDQGGTPRISSQPVREHTPPDLNVDNELSNWRNQKLRVKYLFTIGRIEGVIRDVKKLTHDLDGFMMMRAAKDPSNIGSAQC